MILPQIRCNFATASQHPNVFYILCKGENAGKPSLKPWANSFVVICQHKEYFEFYFWLVYALQQSGKFKIRLRGTAVPFINVNDVRDLIREVAPALHTDWSRLRELITTLDNISKLKSTLEQQIKATENLQKLLLYKFFNEAH